MILKLASFQRKISKVTCENTSVPIPLTTSKETVVPVVARGHFNFVCHTVYWYMECFQCLLPMSYYIYY